MLLEYKPPNKDESSQRLLVETWKLALQHDMKTFVAHHYFQSYVEEKFNRNWGCDDSLFVKFVVTPIKIIPVFLFFPIISMFKCFGGTESANDIDVEENNETTQVEENKETSQVEENKFTSKCSSFFKRLEKMVSTPRLRATVSITTELFYMIMFILFFIDPNDVAGTLDVHWYDWLVLTFAVSYLLEDFVEMFTRRFSDTFLSRCQSFSDSFFTSDSFFSSRLQSPAMWHMYSLYTSMTLATGVAISGYQYYYRLDMEDGRKNLGGNHPGSIF